MRHPIACIFFFFLSQLPNYSNAQNQSNVNCEGLFFYVEKYWARDSIGENGLRLLVANMLKSCPSGTLKGKKWDKFQDIFGKPNSELFQNNLKIFRYKIIFCEGRNTITV